MELLLAVSGIIALFFSIQSANYDALLIQTRLATSNPLNLKHNTRLTLRVVFVFLLTIPVYLLTGFTFWDFLFIFLINGMIFSIPFDLIVGSKAFDDAFYLGESSKIDRFMNGVFGSYSGEVYLAIKTVILIGSIILL